MSEISPESLPSIEGALGGSRGTDVTGGMASKVRYPLVPPPPPPIDVNVAQQLFTSPKLRAFLSGVLSFEGSGVVWFGWVWWFLG